MCLSTIIVALLFVLGLLIQSARARSIDDAQAQGKIVAPNLANGPTCGHIWIYYNIEYGENKQRCRDCCIEHGYKDTKGKVRIFFNPRCTCVGKKNKNDKKPSIKLKVISTGAMQTISDFSTSSDGGD